MKNDDPQIVIIGAAILDVLVRPADADVFRTGSSPAEEILLSPGGDALNEAAVLSKLGKRVRLETIIGNDRAGRFVISYCEECGIELPGDCIRDGIDTGVNVVLVSEDGERHFLTAPKSTLRRLTTGDMHIPFPDSAYIICFASIFVFPEIGPSELEQIFAAAKAQGKLVCADMTKRKKSETTEDLACALKYVDYLFPNDEEAMLLTGKDTVEDAADDLIEAGVGTVVIKCGSGGCYMAGMQGEGRAGTWIPAVQGVKCIDTTGAGDSFAAGFLYALSEGKTPEECAAFANECGARAVAVTGASEWL